MKRIEFVDVAKALAIALVVLGHTVSSDTMTKQILYSFHMPLFFIISGMFLKFEPEKACGALHVIKKNVEKKFQVLIIPLMLWGLIYCSFSLKNLLFVAYGSRETLAIAGSLTSLWFLPVLFLGYIFNLLASYISRITKFNAILLNNVVMVVFFLIGFSLPHFNVYGWPWAFDVAFIAAAYMKLGHNGRDLLIEISHRNFLQKVFFILIGLLGFVVLVPFAKSSVGYVLMANALYGPPAISVVTAVLGSFVVLCFSMVLVQFLSGKLRSFVLFVGMNTMGVFLVHKPMVEIGRKVVEFKGLSYNGIASLFITVFVVLVSAITVYFIKKFAPVLLGETYHEKN